MTDKGLLCTGAAGSAIAAICCFTPVLVIAFGLIGLSAWVGWLDYVLFPMLAFFLALTGYALYRIRQGRLACATAGANATERS
jgi:mercuric ion transport protein